MNCKHIQELILTDYTDGQMTAERQADIRKHIDGCAGCRDFEKAVREISVEPFEQMLMEKVPSSVWFNIREKIESDAPQDDRVPWLDTFWRWGAMVFASRPRLAIVGVLSVLIVTVVSARFLFHPSVDGRSMQYMTEMMDYPAESLDAGYGTGIEEYFL